MTPERRREIASAGGRAAHKAGKGHRFTSEEASKAGKKGGRTIGKNRKHMAKIGRKGGQHKDEQKPGV